SGSSDIAGTDKIFKAVRARLGYFICCVRSSHHCLVSLGYSLGHLQYRTYSSLRPLSRACSFCISCFQTVNELVDRVGSAVFIGPSKSESTGLYLVSQNTCICCFALGCHSAGQFFSI